MTVNKTQPDNSISEAEVKISEVKISEVKNGGGVAINIRSNTSFIYCNGLVSEVLEQDVEKKQLIMTADLNCNFLEQERSICTAKLIDILDIYLLKHIQNPTRVIARSRSLLDVIIVMLLLQRNQKAYMNY